MIELIDLRKSYKLGPVELDILKGVSLTVEDGEMLAIMGASGSGKSTMMNIIGLLDRPTSGTFRFEGRDVALLSDDVLAGIRNRRMGFVFQQFNLMARTTALDNVCLPLLYRGMSLGDARKKAEGFLEKVGMKERMRHLPVELSGGQQQRVAIARALIGEPGMILADEPTGALDTKVGREVLDIFAGLNKDDGITVVIITHDPSVARQCGRTVLMRDGVLADNEAVPA
ncbi:MAG: ABC transporter ATP-binding protein [Alphaproteobacteria bacterium]|nr:ABC transporter ATP-binding protein [Alphaproteobacteria bacterium]